MGKILEAPADLRPLLPRLVDVLLAFDRRPTARCQLLEQCLEPSCDEVHRLVIVACGRLFAFDPEALTESDMLPSIRRLVRESNGFVIETLVHDALFRLPREKLAELYVASSDRREHKYFKRALLRTRSTKLLCGETLDHEALKDKKDIKDARHALRVLYKEKEFSLAADLLGSFNSRSSGGKNATILNKFPDMLIFAAFHTSESVRKKGQELVNTLSIETLMSKAPRLIEELSVPANVSFSATLLSKLARNAQASKLVPPLIPALAVAPVPVMTLLSELDSFELQRHAATLVPLLIESYTTHMFDPYTSRAHPILLELNLNEHASALVDLLMRGERESFRGSLRVVDLLLKLRADVLDPFLPRFSEQLMKLKELDVHGNAARLLDKLAVSDKETLSPFVPEMLKMLACLNRLAWEQEDSRASATTPLLKIDASALAERLASILDVDQISNQIQCDAAESFFALDADVLRNHEQILVRLLLSKAHSSVHKNAWDALGKLDRVAALKQAGKDTIQQLIDRTSDWDVRRHAFHAAKELDHPWAVQLIVGCLNSQDEDLRSDVAFYWLTSPICEGMLEPHRPTLVGLRDHHDESVSEAVREVLGESVSPTASDAATSTQAPEEDDQEDEEDEGKEGEEMPDALKMVKKRAMANEENASATNSPRKAARRTDRRP